MLPEKIFMVHLFHSVYSKDLGVQELDFLPVAEDCDAYWCFKEGFTYYLSHGKNGRLGITVCSWIGKKDYGREYLLDTLQEDQDTAYFSNRSLAAMVHLAFMMGYEIGRDEALNQEDDSDW